MARIVCDEIRLDSLSKEVQQALNLLLKQKGKAAKYWKTIKRNGGRGSFLEAYGLDLSFKSWGQFRTGIKGYPYEGPDIPPNLDAISKMMELGWTSRLYNAFMKWFDGDDLLSQGGAGHSTLNNAEINNRRKFLLKFLSNK